MKMQIKEFSKLVGVSVRTLHYYDEIGLLKPSFVDEQNGYRFYSEEAFIRMQEIMFYRELDFSLKSIKEILSSPYYDKKKALKEQKRLLILKKQRLERIINALEDAQKGELNMSMNIFDNSEFETARKKYQNEAKEKWGNTDAYKESERRTSEYSDEKWNEIDYGMNSLINEFAKCMKSGISHSDSDAKALAQRWQAFITENYYNCTKQILSGLASMYVCDGRFKKNIDKYAEGTAEFMSNAIIHYCNE